MTRAIHKDDFTVDVEHIGTFKFGRRVKKDQFKIRGIYSRLTGDNWKEDEESGQLVPGDMEAWMYVTLEVLTVEFPSNFSLESLDPLKDPEDDDRLGRIYLALRQKEASFRTPPPASSTATGSGTGS